MHAIDIWVALTFRDSTSDSQNARGYGAEDINSLFKDYKGSRNRQSRRFSGFRYMACVTSLLLQQQDQESANATQRCLVRSPVV